MKEREPRRTVLVRARIRIGPDWGDVVIHNMSSRGLLIAADATFRPGAVIEIRRVHHIVIGRVVWKQGRYMGVRTQDPIDMDGIVSAKPPSSKPSIAGASADRRAVSRAPSVAERAERSRQLSRIFQFATLLAAVGAAAAIVAVEVASVLGRPLRQISARLSTDDAGTPATGSSPDQ